LVVSILASMPFLAEYSRTARWQAGWCQLSMMTKPPDGMHG